MNHVADNAISIEKPMIPASQLSLSFTNSQEPTNKRLTESWGSWQRFLLQVLQPRASDKRWLLGSAGRL